MDHGDAAVDSAKDNITVKYDFKNPVEIGRFSESLEGLAEIYKAQVARAGEVPKELRLYIREIRKGSVEVDIIEMVKTAGGALAPILADVKLAAETVQRVKQLVDYLKGASDKPVEATKKEIEATSHFLAPIAENSGSNVQIHVNNSPQAIIMIGSVDANAVQNGATRTLELMKEPVKQILTEVPLVWQQTDRHGAIAGRTGLKAVVEEVSATAMPVYFLEANQSELKERMIAGVEFPYSKTFIVDVETIVVMGKLKGYKVLRLHDVLD